MLNLSYNKLKTTFSVEVFSRKGGFFIVVRRCNARVYLSLPSKRIYKKDDDKQASRIERIFLTKKRNFRIRKYFSACSKSIRAIKATMWIETTQRYLQALNDFELIENAMPSSNFETHRVKILV